MPKKARSRPEVEPNKFVLFVESRTGSRHGIYQKDLAAALGLSESSFSVRMKSGHFRFEEIQALFGILGATKEDIWNVMK